MLKRTKLADRMLPVYSVGEEIANTATHLLGGVLGILTGEKAREKQTGIRNYFLKKKKNLQRVFIWELRKNRLRR